MRATSGQRLLTDASRGTHADTLTRTTLQIEGGASASSIAAAVRALQRVPGVLLADMLPANTRAIVAHDAAVDAASLVNAVAAAGIRAAIVAPPRAVGRSGGPPVYASAALVRGIASAIVVFATLTLVNLAVQGGADRRWLLPVASTSLLLFLITRSIGTRRP